MGDRSHGNVWGLAPLDDPLETDPSRRYKAIYEIGPPGFRVADELPGLTCDGPIPPTASTGRPTTSAHVRGAGRKAGRQHLSLLRPLHAHLQHPHSPSVDGNAPRPRVGLVEKAIAGGSTTDPAYGLPNRRGMRRIFQSQSRDFHHWSEPRLALAPDPELDNLDDSFYSMRPYRLGAIGWPSWACST